MTTTRTTEELITLLKTCPAIQSINPWNDRFYLNLWDSSKSFRGDMTTKWFIDARGILNYDSGKGTRSGDFRASLETLRDFLTANEIEFRMAK